MSERDWSRRRRAHRLDRSRDIMMHPEYYDHEGAEWERGRGRLDYDPRYERFDEQRFGFPPFYRAVGHSPGRSTWLYQEYWIWQPGPFSGLGPKNYQRSDERIFDEVNHRLKWHGLVDARDIEVKVENGMVMLNGTVNNRYEKRLVEDLAESVPGVWGVMNNIRLRRAVQVQRLSG